MHLLSDVDNVLCDTVLGGKISESLHSHSAELPTYKNKKLCQKEVEKENIQSVFLLRIHSLSKKSEQVAWMKLIITFDQRTLLYYLLIYLWICAHPQPAIM